MMNLSLGSCDESTSVDNFWNQVSGWAAILEFLFLIF